MEYSAFLSLRKQIIENDFKRMNDMQKKAVFQLDGPLLILAGAGSGKTTVLVNRIANMLKYGEAYQSDQSIRLPNEQDLSLMQAYLDGDTEVYPSIADILSVRAPQPWQILAITFTNKAAKELKERLVAKIGESAEDIWASTFHSCCVRILRRFGDLVGFTSRFTIYDTDDCKRVIKECQRLLNIDDRFLSYKTILNEISRAKDSLIDPTVFQQTTEQDTRLEKIGECYQKYQQLLKQADAMDFDDIIFYTVKLLEENPDVLEHYQNQFHYVMVDEYQDTNHAQYKLTSLLAGGRNNLCVVGDDDQSIYKFRGATIENILSFEMRYENAVVIRLEQNYRSTQRILDAANAVIANNEQRKGKNLWTSNGQGDKIVVKTAEDERAEADFIAEQILDNVAKGAKYGDHAILYRMNALSGTIERSFIKRAIPYRIFGGHKFYDRMEIRDMIAYLSLINNPADNVRLQRIINIPKRSIGATTVNKLSEMADVLGTSMFEVVKTADQYEVLRRSSSKLIEFAHMIDELSDFAETSTPSQVLSKLIEDTGYLQYLRTIEPEKYDDRLQNLDELLSTLIHFEEENPEGTLRDYLEEVALLTDIDNYNADADAVVLMTLHAAKGLEFPAVFIVGMEEGIFPGNMDADDEEERRLAYVGITRAKQKLFLSYAKTRIVFGSTHYNQPSKFLGEIPNHLVELKSSNAVYSSYGYSSGVKHNKENTSRVHAYSTESTENRASNRGFSKPITKHSSAPLPDFHSGDAVEHKTFGVGVISTIRPMGNDLLLEVVFQKTGTKKLMARAANLKKL